MAERSNLKNAILVLNMSWYLQTDKNHKFIMSVCQFVVLLFGMAKRVL
jgi:hypothetical protein